MPDLVIGPLSAAQRRLLFLDELEPGSTRYVSRLNWILSGPVDSAALAAALRSVLRRHELLRARVEPMTARLVIDADPELPLRVHALTDGLIGTADGARRLLDRLAAEPFDLAVGPLMRADLVAFGPDHAAFQLCIHHLIFDGRSRTVLEADLSAAYNALLAGGQPPAAASVARYLDYTRQEQADDAAGLLDEQVSAWCDLLGGAPPTLDLAGYRDAEFAASEQIQFSLSASTVAGLEALARQCRSSTFVVALAAHLYCLAVLGRTDDPVVGVPVSGRLDADFDDVIGMFVNAVAIRPRPARSWTFRMLVDAVQDVLLDAIDNQQAPFERIVDRLATSRVATRNPIFQHWFDLSDARQPPEALQLDGIDASRYEPALATVRFETELILLIDPAGSVATLTYDAARLPRQSMVQLAELFSRLLRVLTTEPDHCLSDIALISEDHSACLPGSDAPVEVEGPDAAPDVLELIDRCGATQPMATAISAGNRSISYDEMALLSGSLAAELRSVGVVAGDVVALVLPRTVDVVIVLVAILRLGAVYLPIAPELPPSRIEFMIEDSQARVVIAGSPADVQWPAVADRSTLLLADGKLRSAATGSAEGAKSAVPPGDYRPGPNDPAYLIYTSGSSGRPKGVLATRAGLANLVRWHLNRYQLAPSDRVLLTASLSFDASGWEIWPSLAAGAWLEICPQETLTSPPALYELIRQHGITVMFAPTPVAELLIRLPLADTSLRTLLTGGDVFRPRSQDRPGVPVVNHYGPTEATVVATASPSLGWPWRDVTIGRTIHGVRGYVLDPVGRPVPAGVVGELFLGGCGVALGYAGRAGLTAAAFQPDSFSDRPGSRLYATGDLVSHDAEGTLRYLGRVDSQVKVRGLRIEPGEIEQTLLELADIAEAAVGRAISGAGTEALVAWVVAASSDVQLDAAWLRQSLGQRLPGWMVPDRIEQVAALPMTATGKPDRRALRGWTVDQGPGRAPRSEFEQLMCLLWSQVLGGQKIGLDEDFFALGGNSFTATALIGLVRARFDTWVPLRALFDARTPQALCELVAEAAEAEIAALTDDEIRSQLAAAQGPQESGRQL